MEFRCLSEIDPIVSGSVSQTRSGPISFLRFKALRPSPFAS